jgi:outer membrane protein assembly factor BamB
MVVVNRLVFALILLATLNCGLNAQDWPQWRGAAFDNLSAETNLPTEFGKDSNMQWRIELPGPAGASPVVFGDHIFVTSVVEKDNSLVLICFAKDGTEKWSRPLKGESQFVRIDSANSASPSPCTDGNHVWATTGVGFVECFDMNGEPIWTVDLQKRYGEFQIQFGMASTPILHEDVLYFQMIHGAMRQKGTSVGHVVALNAKTGEEIWHHVRKTDGIAENRHSYASPTLMHVEDSTQLITHGGDYVIGHSLTDGSEIWRCGGMNPKGEGYNKYLRFVASPTFADGKLLVPSAKKGPVLCLKADLAGDITDDAETRHWVLRRGTPDVACPVVHEGLVYLAREDGTLMIVEFESGEEVITERRFGDRHRSTPVVADGKIYVTGRKGTVYVIEPGREAKVLAENELGEQMTASPAIAGGRIYIRTWNALYSFGNE